MPGSPFAPGGPLESPGSIVARRTIASEAQRTARLALAQTPQPSPGTRRPAKPLPTDSATLGKLARGGVTAQDVSDYNAGRINGDELAARSLSRLQSQRIAETKRAYPNMKVDAAGVVAVPPHGPVDQFFKDLTDAAIGMPAGLALTGAAGYHDVGALAHGHAPTHLYHDVAVPMAQSMKESVLHPLAHPGFTALNAWAIGSLGAGALARAGAVREAIAGAAPADAAAAMRNLPRADRGARDVLLDPVSNFNPGDVATIRRIVQPSKRLAQLLDKHPGMAEARKAVLERIGQEGQPARERTLGEVAREVVRAGARRPAPAERSITLPSGEVVHPVGSKNALANAIQQRMDRHTEASMGREPLHPGAPSPESKSGRELAAERAVRESAELGLANRLEGFGRTTKQRAIRRPTRSRLSAGEQKTIDIISSGLTPAEHYASHLRAAELARQGVKKYGDPAMHEAQAALAKAADAHFANTSQNLQNATHLSRHAIQTREQILGLTDDEIAHRVGARAAEIKSLAHGEESPLLARQKIVEQLNALPPHPGNSVPMRDRLQQVETELAQYRTTPRSAERAVAGLGGDRPRDAGYNALSREASDLKTKLDADAQRAELQLQLELIDHSLIEHGREAIARGGFYLPSKELTPTRRVGQANISPGEFGYAPPRGLTELRYPYEGKLRHSGNFRTDATGLAADAFRGAQRLASLERGYAQILRLSHETPEAAGGEQFAIPVRETASIPKALRELVLKADRGDLSEKDLAAINSGQTDVAALVREFFPETGATGNRIRYVDSRLVKRLAEQRALPSDVLKAFDALNNVGRAGILYLKPAYIVNLLQNLGMATIEQGPFVMRNARAALRLGQKIGADDQHMIYSIMGEGHSRALDVGAGLGERAIHGAAEFWNAVTDRVPRVMAFLHEARAAGFDGPTALKALLHDPQFADKLVEVARRANREMVDYGGMTPLERNTIRRVFLFYPWLRGATLWSLRFPIEHPGQATVHGNLGQQGRQWERNTLGALPAHLEGDFPLYPLRSGHDPFVTNPRALNTFTTPVEIGQALAGLAGPSAGAHAADLGGMFTPGLGALETLATGQTDLGYPLPANESRLTGAASQLIGSAAPVSLLEKATKRNLLTGRKLHEGTTDKGPAAAIRGALGGALAGTHLDLQKAHEQARKEQRAGMTPEQRISSDVGEALASMPKQLNQLKAKGLNIAPEYQKAVRDAVHLQADRDLAYTQAAKQAGISARDLPQIDKLSALTSVLEQGGRLTPEQAAQWRAYYATQPDEKVKQGIEKLWRDVGAGKTLGWWRHLTGELKTPQRTASVNR